MGKGSTWNCERVGHPGELGGKELASRRKEQRLTMLHKILHGELAIPMMQLFVWNSLTVL